MAGNIGAEQSVRKRSRPCRRVPSALSARRQDCRRWEHCTWKKAVLASPSFRKAMRARCLAIMRSIKTDPGPQLAYSAAACSSTPAASYATRILRQWLTCSLPAPSHARFGTRPWLGSGFPASLPMVLRRCWSGPYRANSPPQSPCTRSCLHDAPNPLDALETEEGVCLRQRPALHFRPAFQDKATLSRSGLRVVLPSTWDVHSCS